MKRRQRTAREWFAEAARFYVEGHQGCAWCGNSYCVSKSQDDASCEYSCNCCDFRAIYDAAADRHFSYAGEDMAGTKPPTMFEI